MDQATDAYTEGFEAGKHIRGQEIIAAQTAERVALIKAQTQFYRGFISVVTASMNTGDAGDKVKKQVKLLSESVDKVEKRHE